MALPPQHSGASVVTLGAGVASSLSLSQQLRLTDRLPSAAWLINVFLAITFALLALQVCAVPPTAPAAYT